MAGEDILTAPEVAAELRISRAEVYRIINGQVRDLPALPVIPIGRRRLVQRSALERWKRDSERCLGGAKMGAAHSIDSV